MLQGSCRSDRQTPQTFSFTYSTLNQEQATGRTLSKGGVV